jgi:hypothetical protein
MKDKNVDLLADFQNIFNVFKEHGVINDRQTEIHTAEPLVPEPDYFEVDINVEILERYKLTVIDQILEELI